MKDNIAESHVDYHFELKANSEQYIGFFCKPVLALTNKQTEI